MAIVTNLLSAYVRASVIKTGNGVPNLSILNCEVSSNNWEACNTDLLAWPLERKKIVTIDTIFMLIRCVKGKTVGWIRSVLV